MAGAAGFPAIWDSRFARFVRMGGGSSALGGAVARPRDDRQKDLLRPALEEIIDLGHPLVRLARAIDWGFLDQRFCRRLHAGSGPARPADPSGGGAVHPEAHAQPVGRSAVCALAGEPLLPILLRRAELLPSAPVRPLVTDALAPAAGRGATGGADPVALIQESLSVAHNTGALATRDLERVVVDTTVQPKPWQPP